MHHLFFKCLHHDSFAFSYWYNSVNKNWVPAMFPVLGWTMQIHEKDILPVLGEHTVLEEKWSWNNVSNATHKMLSRYRGVTITPIQRRWSLTKSLKNRVWEGGEKWLVRQKGWHTSKQEKHASYWMYTVTQLKIPGLQ